MALEKAVDGTAQASDQDAGSNAVDEQALEGIVGSGQSKTEVEVLKEQVGLLSEQVQNATQYMGRYANEVGAVRQVQSEIGEIKSLLTQGIPGGSEAFNFEQQAGGTPNQQSALTKEDVKGAVREEITEQMNAQTQAQQRMIAEYNEVAKDPYFTSIKTDVDKMLNDPQVSSQVYSGRRSVRDVFQSVALQKTHGIIRDLFANPDQIAAIKEKQQQAVHSSQLGSQADGRTVAKGGPLAEAKQSFEEGKDKARTGDIGGVDQMLSTLESGGYFKPNK